jgi:16S rRNA (cytosine1402-N4)-methyltransferase
MSIPPAAGGSSRSVHIPVLLREVLQQLELQPGLIVVDGTVGAGGHSSRIWPLIQPGGRLIGLDRDDSMLARAAALLTDPQIILKQASYQELPAILDQLQIPQIDRLLLDLGLSSDQLADPHRGFGFQTTAPLDMRFDTRQGPTAQELLNTSSAAELTHMLTEFGELPQPQRLVQELIRRREQGQLRTAEDLRECVEATIPTRSTGSHPATRVFQALRIAVNAELQHLQNFLTHVLPGRLRPGGIAAIITFHSLEDRLVKHAFREESLWQDLTRKPIEPTPAEVRYNPRSRSAKLRVARRKDFSA